LSRTPYGDDNTNYWGESMTHGFGQSVFEDDGVELKGCAKCGRKLPLSEFNKAMERLKLRTGLLSWCRECAEHRRRELRGPVHGVKTYLMLHVMTGCVKIGRTTNADRRLNDINGMIPGRVVLLVLLDGDHEAALHTRLKHARVPDSSREWFHRCEELVAVVREYEDVWLDRPAALEWITQHARRQP